MWKIWIEEAANGHAIIDALGRQVPGIIGVTPEGGKVARAHAAQPSVEAGNIWLPNLSSLGDVYRAHDSNAHECAVTFPGR